MILTDNHRLSHNDRDWSLHLKQWRNIADRFREQIQFADSLLPLWDQRHWQGFAILARISARTGTHWATTATLFTS